MARCRRRTRPGAKLRPNSWQGAIAAAWYLLTRLLNKPGATPLERVRASSPTVPGPWRADRVGQLVDTAILPRLVYLVEPAVEWNACPREAGARGRRGWPVASAC